MNSLRKWVQDYQADPQHAFPGEAVPAQLGDLESFATLDFTGYRTIASTSPISICMLDPGPPNDLRFCGEPLRKLPPIQVHKIPDGGRSA